MSRGAASKAYTAYIDGAARGNPGPAAVGVVLMQGGQTVDRYGESIGRATNNVAEYRAFIKALEMAVDREAHSLQVFTDSELLSKQWSGAYRVKNPGLKDLYRRARRLESGLARVAVSHVPRENNREADRLCNQALDDAGKG